MIRSIGEIHAPQEPRGEQAHYGADVGVRGRGATIAGVFGSAADGSAERATRRLVLALRDPACYPHAAANVELIETHISYVLLAGEFAYKIKKPVNFGFLDFTTLAARRQFCDEELRLNARTAPALYLDVVAVTGTPDQPALGGPGEPIEYAVRMRAFRRDALCDLAAERGELTAAHVESVAHSLARLHGQAPRADPDSRFGTGALVLASARENFAQIAALEGVEPERARLAALAHWTDAEYRRLAEPIAQRRRSGRVRECHGDLHLGNVALIDGEPVIFDAIEFNAGLRWIDVISDVAFLFMDLVDYGQPPLAYRFLNTWLELTGDYEGLVLLRFYAAYRAMVRAKVACLRRRQSGVPAAGQASATERFREYLTLAERLAQPAPAWLAITSGLSGSGKSTLALAVVEHLQAICLRSDVERKRLAALAPLARTGSGVGAGIYSAAADRRTYRRLLKLANEILTAGYPVIVDATFVRGGDRAAFRELAFRRGTAFTILFCTAPMATLLERLSGRWRQGEDASEATPDVLAFQSGRFEALGMDELRSTLTVDTGCEAPPFAAALGGLRARLAGATAT
ncbi:MAG: AAA family ATPase [Gammaproteobacteria bacterium]|nr:AAA family ATPase [Gammaproteobacteria bacterium]